MKVHLRCSLLLFTLTLSCAGLDRLQQMCTGLTETKGGDRKETGKRLSGWIRPIRVAKWCLGEWHALAKWALTGSERCLGKTRPRQETGIWKINPEKFSPRAEVPLQKRTRVPHVSACEWEVKPSRFYVASLIALAHLTWPAITWLLFSFSSRLQWWWTLYDPI